jgi:hypothetical protein
VLGRGVLFLGHSSSAADFSREFYAKRAVLGQHVRRHYVRLRAIITFPETQTSAIGIRKSAVFVTCR